MTIKFFRKRIRTLEFERDVLKDNFSRLKILSIIMAIIQHMMVDASDYLYKTTWLAWPFLITSFLMIPLIWIVRVNSHRFPLLLAKAIQYFYALSIMAFGIAMTCDTQPQVDMVLIYLMAVFGVTIALYMPPWQSIILLLSASLAFAFIIPNYIDGDKQVYVTNFNVVLFTIFAWIQSQMHYKMKISQYRDRHMIEEKSHILEDIARRDSMTMLLNHVTAMEILQTEIERANEIKTPLALIFADIDNFKHINDQYGHQTGDRVIIEVARVLSETVRSSDILCRYGGEEFVIIMPDTDLSAAQSCASRLIEALGNAQFEHEITVTLSGGISQYQGETIDEFIRTTDEKLYLAKAAGKNQFVAAA